MAAIYVKNKETGEYVKVSTNDSGGDASSLIDAHNSSADAHADIREAVDALSTKIVYQVPAGVKAEASSVVDKALSHSDTNVFRFLAVADAHQKNDHELITAGNVELGQGVGEVLRMIGVDLVSNLGDICWGSSASDLATVLQEGKAFNAYFLDSVRGQTQIWTEGNHETNWLTESQIHALIYSHNKGLTQDVNHFMEGYGYLDFPAKKVRVICLNTNQGTASGNVSGMSDEQVKWFAEVALNMEGKTDWNVITMGHHPLSHNTVSLMRYAAETVKAFVSGANFSYTTNGGTSISIDYRERNCQYVAHFHGHAHAFSVVKMQHYVSSGVYEAFDAWEICIPNACYERNNQYKGVAYEGQYVQRYATETTYNKSDVDGKRTAFNLITVCLDSKIIYADNFGSGIDRVVAYEDAPLPKYSITRNLTNCMSSNENVEIVAGESHTEAFIPMDGFTMTGANVTVTMGGVDITASAYYYGIVNIASVTGDVVITVVAVKESGTPSYTNQIPISTDTDGSIYNGVGYKENTYLSSGNPSARDGIDCSGFIPIGIGSSVDATGEQVVRMQGITASNATTFRIAFYDAQKAYLGVQIYGTQFDTNGYEIPLPYETDESGNYTYIDFTAITAILKTKDLKETAFIRICCPNIDGNSILTVNEPIE